MDVSQYYLTRHDMMRVGQVFLHAVGCALLVEAVQIIPNVNFGTYTPIIMALLLPVLQAAQRAAEPASPSA